MTTPNSAATARPDSEVRARSEGGRWRQFRYPLGVGLLLFVGALLWGWSTYVEDRALFRQNLSRHAHSLAEALSVAARTDDAAFSAALRANLQINAPILFVVVRRGDTVVVQVGPETAAQWPPGDHPDTRLRVERVPLGQMIPIPELPGHGEPPWVWRDAAAVGTDVLVDVGLDTTFAGPPQNHAILRLALVTGLAWLAIAALIWAWMRSMSARRLEVALGLERRERAYLEEMNLAAAGLAHETKNPIGIIFGLAQRLAADPKLAPRHQEAAEQILDAADRATARLGDFINFAHRPSPQLAPVSLDALLKRVVAVLEPDFEARGVRLKCVASDLVVRCDHDMLEQLLVNLLLNSLHASSAGSTTTVEASRVRELATLSVRDEGCGVPEALRADIFKPYVTGREGGHGMGLAIVKRIVEQHGWTVGLESAPAQGTTVRIAGLTPVEADT